MNYEEFMKLVDQMKAQGMTDDDLLGTILQMFKDGKIDVEDMKKMAGALGYELTEKFLSMSEGEGIDRIPADAKEEGAKGFTEEEVEDAQEYEPGEDDDDSDSEDEDEEYEEEEDEEEESEDEEYDDSEEEDEEDEKEKVRRMYGD